MQRIGKGLSSTRKAARIVACGAGLAMWGVMAEAAPKTHTPMTGPALASLLNNKSGPQGVLELGDTIELASTVYSGAEVVLPNVTVGSGWITIQPTAAALANLPGPGVRVKPWNPATSPVPGQLNHQIHMPKIKSYMNNAPAIRTANEAHNFKFIGIEIYKGDDANEQLDCLIKLGNDTITNGALQPSNIVFDRCYMHGLLTWPVTLHTKTGVKFNCFNAAVINCHVSDIFSNSQQAVGVGGINGAGPYLIDNNFISASGENILFGGGAGKVVGQVPTGITITRNHLWKDPKWSGSTATCNHFELKMGRQVQFTNNFMENNWDTQGQGGNSINLKVANVGASPWFVTEDVNVINNIAHNIGMGFTLQGDDYGAGHVGWVRRINIKNNLMYGIRNDLNYGTGYAFHTAHGPEYVTWDHNTMIHNGTSTKFMNVDSPVDANDDPTEWVPGAVYTNNLTVHGKYGIYGTGTQWGDDSIGHYMPGGVWQKNVMINTYGYGINQLTGWFAGNPGGWVSPLTPATAFPATWTTVITDPANPGTNYNNFKVKAPYIGAGTDGKDIGADIPLLVTATSGCVSGTWSFNPNSPNASDGFPYSGSLNGNNEIGYGFDPNPWTQFQTSTSPALAAGSMTYTDSAGNVLRVRGNKLQPAANSKSYRNLPAANQFVPQPGDVLWVSFRVNHTGPAGSALPSNHAGFALYSSLNADPSGDELFLGNPGFSGQNWGFNPEGGTRMVANGSVQTGAPRNVFLLYKLEYGASNATVKMWINPVITSESGLGPPTLTGTQPGLDPIRSVWFSTGGTSTGYQFDELRLGRTFFSVTPH